MCILLKFDSAKFGVSNLLFSKVIEEKPFEGRLDSLPPLGIRCVKEGLKTPYKLSVHSQKCNMIG